jgi:RHS repeat-associated protein
MPGAPRDDEPRRGPRAPNTVPEPALPGPATEGGPAPVDMEPGDDTPPELRLDPPSITLPKGGGELRGLDEQVSVSAPTGTATLRVPLFTSPGRGFAPELSLTYRSGGGNGAFGLGWSVGLPSISRKTDGPLPRHGDDDTFLLDDGEQLVPALLADGDGWRSDTEVRDGEQVHRYRPRNEAAFTRIERLTDLATGAVHWRTVTRDNVVRVFGRSEGHRVADPGDPRRVLRWLIEEAADDRGNLIVYRYRREDLSGVDPTAAHEGTRTAASAPAQRYPERILYGNEVPFERGGWHFEVVFDYGDHDADQPGVEPSGEWPVRADPFSNCRGGFELRTWRLCRRVLMFHRFGELGATPYLVRSTDLGYDERPTVTLLTSVTQRGYVRDADGEPYRSRALPPLEVTYTPDELVDEVRDLEPGSLDNLPAGPDGGRVRWTDLDGEGLPGVLHEDPGAWYYKRNLGGGRLGALEAVGARPAPGDAPAAVGGATAAAAPVGLGGGAATLVSLTGDGRQDLVRFDGPAAGAYLRDHDGAWLGFRAFPSAPTVAVRRPDARLVDLTGDGLADLLITADDRLVWYAARGRDGFAEAEAAPVPLDEDAGPALVFSDRTESVFIADMSGDGLPDLVRVREGSVCYWPNLGYGRFGARIEMTDPPRLAPAELFDPRRVRLGDLDGSGTADLVYVGSGSVQMWRNAAGNRWLGPTALDSFPDTDDLSSVELVDLLGSGTPCLVWASPLPADGRRRIRYAPLMGGGKPHLLRETANNRGRRTTLHTVPSTRLSIQDRLAGRPWATTPPFPVHVVERLETVDEITGARLVTSYRYRHGYYDAEDREFRGFGFTEQRDTESFAHFALSGAGNVVDATLHQPPAVTRTWYATGCFPRGPALAERFAAEWWDGDPQAPPLAPPVLPAGLDAAGTRDALRALTGRPLRQEVYAEDGSPGAGHPYRVGEHRYAVRVLQPGRDGSRAVTHAYALENVNRHYERDPADPRVDHDLTLEVDEFGVAVRSAAVAYPRRGPGLPEQSAPLVTYRERDVAHRSDAAVHRLGTPVADRDYELTGVALPPAVPLTIADLDAHIGGAARLAFHEPLTPGATQLRLRDERRVVYWNDAVTAALPPGEVGGRALPHHTRHAALTPELVAAVYAGRVGAALLGDGGYQLDDGVWWAPSGTWRFDPAAFFNPVAYRNPFGNEFSSVYDGHGLLVEQVDDPLGNRTTAVNDYRLGGPVRVTDANGNRSAVEVDELGMVTALWVMGKEGEPDPAAAGDPAGAPSKRFTYDLDAWRDHGRPTVTGSIVRERHGGGPSPEQRAFAYHDGAGRVVQSKAQAEPGPAPQRDGDGALVRDAQGRPVPADTAPAVRWIGSGRTVWDNKGNAIKQYEPFFSATADYENEDDLVAWGVTPVMRHDPLGRLVASDLPDGTRTRVEFDVWQTRRWDPNDTVTGSDWETGRLALPAGSPGRRAAELTAGHAATPQRIHLDVLGRAVRSVADDGLGGMFETRTVLDIGGKVLSVFDERGVEAATTRYDMLGRSLHQRTADGGPRWTLDDVTGSPVAAWDATGRRLRHAYDDNRRLTTVRLREAGNPETVVSLAIYGEPLPGAADRNLRTRVWRQYDTAGAVTTQRFDFKGNILAATRKLAADHTVIPDWTALEGLAPGDHDAAAAGLLEAEAFTTASAYDAMDRVVRLELPDGTVVLPEFNEGALLERVRAEVRGGAATTFVEDVGYDARGQRTRIAYGNGVATDYTYDPATFRLDRLRTVRAGDGAVLQDITYTYDAVGNVVAVGDGAQQAVFFDNAVVPADARYRYDALYRLVQAEGREDPAGGQRDAADPPQRTVPHPNDAQALRRWRQTYAYDPAGNLLEVVHTLLGGGAGPGWHRRHDYAADSNRLLATSRPGDPAGGPFSAQYAYDDHGNVETLPGGLALGWDFRDHLRRVDLGGGGTAWSVFDGAGQRVRKVVERGGGLVEERVYLSGYEIFRRRRNGAVERERHTVHVMDGTRRIALVETRTVHDGQPLAAAETVTSFQLANHLDSALLEVDEAGQVVSYEEYEPFGATCYRAARAGVEAGRRRYRFLGRERDDETGLYLLGARFYAPWLGRWLSPDPAGLVDGPNLYRYARNNPVTLSDPAGLDPPDPQPSGFGLTIDTGGGVRVGPIGGGSAACDELNPVCRGLRLTIGETPQISTSVQLGEPGQGFVPTFDLPLPTPAAPGERTAAEGAEGGGEQVTPGAGEETAEGGGEEISFPNPRPLRLSLEWWARPTNIHGQWAQGPLHLWSGQAGKAAARDALRLRGGWMMGDIAGAPTPQHLAGELEFAQARARAPGGLLDDADFVRIWGWRSAEVVGRGAFSGSPVEAHGTPGPTSIQRRFEWPARGIGGGLRGGLGFGTGMWTAIAGGTDRNPWVGVGLVLSGVGETTGAIIYGSGAILGASEAMALGGTAMGVFGGAGAVIGFGSQAVRDFDRGDTVSGLVNTAGAIGGGLLIAAALSNPVGWVGLAGAALVGFAFGFNLGKWLSD